MDDKFGEWVESMGVASGLVGVVSRRWVWLVGGIYGHGYNVEVWLVGVVVRRYIAILIIIINFPYILHLY